MSRVWLCSAPLLAIPFLAGCNDGYSADLRYPVRTDPILTKTLTKEQAHPDMPGQLPVMTFARLQDPQFILYDLRTDALNPAQLAPQDRATLQSTLEVMFGTPTAPVVNAASDSESAVADQLRTQLKLTPELLKDGSWLYRQHCLHCHGLAGDGRGPTSFWVNPHPRDYREGKYKFVSTAQPQGGEQRPMREDIVRTITQGLDGTAMPAFNVLPTPEIEAIASYVIHLGLRGEIEEDSIVSMLKEAPGQRDWDAKERVASGLRVFGDRWIRSQKEVDPDPYPYTTDEQMTASVKRGWEIFKKEVAQGGGDCLKCHTNYGRGSSFRFDDWGTMTRPADLTAGIYRGGRRPIDLYWRIHNGIVGSGMIRSPQFRPNAKEKEEKVDHLWDLVNFLQVLPYPQMRAKYEIRID